MAALKIATHDYKKLDSVEMSFDGNSLSPRTHKQSRLETVQATFDIEGGEPFARQGRSATKIRPEQLHVTFRSINGGAWNYSRYDTTVTGQNLRKDGTLGAEASLNWYDLPDWAKALYERDADHRSDALDWVRSEYQR